VAKVSVAGTLTEFVPPAPACAGAVGASTDGTGAEGTEEDGKAAVGAGWGLLYFCQASQSMNSEKKKMPNSMKRRLSMNDLLDE
jgi:hypothetical protein